jgi:hypothetical protein
MKRIIIVLASAAAILSGSCSKNPVEPLEFPFSSPALVPENAEVDGLLLGIDCFVWRDFMPSMLPSGPSGMMAAVKIFDSGQRALPEDLLPTCMWVIAGDGEVWGAPIREDMVSGAGSSEMTVAARNGPGWEKGIKVDVVVKLERAREKFYLRQSDVTVIRTE